MRRVGGLSAIAQARVVPHIVPVEVPAHWCLDLCLEADLPPGGLIFTEPGRVQGEEEVGKSWGHWRSAATLVFSPDGRVIGKFLDLCCDVDPDNLGHGHRSVWEARYQVFPDPVLRECAMGLESGRRCAMVIRVHDVRDLSTQDAGLNELSLQGRERRGCLLGHRIVGTGSEEERLQAAKAIAKTRYADHLFDLESGRLNAVGAWRARPLCKRVLTVWPPAEDGISDVVCRAMSGDIVCSFSLSPSSCLKDLRSLVERAVGDAVLVTSEGLLLDLSADDKSLVAVFGSGSWVMVPETSPAVPAGPPANGPVTPAPGGLEPLAAVANAEIVATNHRARKAPKREAKEAAKASVCHNADARAKAKATPKRKAEAKATASANKRTKSG